MSNASDKYAPTDDQRRRRAFHEDVQKNASNLRDQIELRTIIVSAFDAGVRAAEMQGTPEYRKAKVHACEQGEAAIKAHSLQEQRDRLDKIYTYMPSAKEVFAMCEAKDVDGLYGVIENVDTEIAWNIGKIDEQLEDY